MAFGQQSGPPATAKQLQFLLALVQQAGHADFRDGRGPLGLTQRQAAGKFTRTEASELIDRLQAGDAATDETDGDPPPAVTPSARPKPTSPPRTIREIPAERLAAELERRGWTVTPPPT